MAGIARYRPHLAAHSLNGQQVESGFLIKRQISRRISAARKPSAHTLLIREAESIHSFPPRFIRKPRESWAFVFQRVGPGSAVFTGAPSFTYMKRLAIAPILCFAFQARHNRHACPACPTVKSPQICRFSDELLLVISLFFYYYPSSVYSRKRG